MKEIDPFRSKHKDRHLMWGILKVFRKREYISGSVTLFSSR